VNDPDQATRWSVVSVNDDLEERLWIDDEIHKPEDRPAVDLTGGLVSLGFISASLKRKAWVWCTIGVIGLLIGCGLYIKFPPGYQASTSLILNDGPNVDTAVAIQTDATLATSRTVGSRVVQQLGLKQSVGGFLAAYSVTVVSNQLLQITVHAPSSSEAVTRASAIAQAFLQFRSQYAHTQLQDQIAGLNQQVTQARQNLRAISNRISQLSAEASSPSVQSERSNLEAQRTSATSALGQVEEFATGSIAQARANANAIVQYSRVVDTAAPISHSRLKGAALYLAGGLVGGLAVGMGIVVVMALVSDRMRRRDDVAEAMGAPVRLSLRSTLRARPLGARARNLDTRRLVAHVRAFIPRSSRGPAGLAVVAVDNAEDVARGVVALAVSYANRGKRVVVADLSEAASAGRLLGTKDPGVRAVSHDGAQVIVAVPDPGQVAPVGPLNRSMSEVEDRQPDEDLVAACDSADLLLSLVSLDPAFGGDHLATWATDAVAVVTAGRSSGERIHGVGEMIKLAGARLVSVVLLGADKSDVSLGTVQAPDEQVAGRSL
jgi:capsular polysaccharide biosynthesis protein